MISQEFAETLKGARPRPALFLRFASNPVGRIWIGGVGPIELPASSIDSTGGVYVGSGQVEDLPAFQSLINGQAESIEIVFSGMTPEIIGLAQEQKDEVRGLKVHLGLAGLDEAWQLASKVYWLWSANLDAPRIGRTRSGDGTFSRSVVLPASTSSIFRRRPRFPFFTDSSQKLRSATDRGCERVSFYNLTRTRKWP